MADEHFKQFDWPLNGRLITKLDPALLPEGHFQELQNLRYNDGGIEGISGMTKINAAAMNYTKLKAGFQFRKEVPNTESHVLAQTTSGANSRIVKSDNTTSIPAQDTFSTFITLPTNNYVNFTEAPDQSMVACDGYTNYVYSGNEYRVARVINFDPNGTFSYDFTQIANNNLTDSNNVFSLSAVASGGLDSDVISLLHFENNVTDSSLSPLTYTNTGVTFSNSDFVFGSYSAIFDGSTSFLTTPDAAIFDFSSGIFTIDGRFKVSSLAAVNPIYYQQTTAEDDSIKFYIDTDGSVKLIIKAAAADVVTVSSPPGTILVNTWPHITLVENGDDWYIFVDGILVGLSSDTDRAANYTGVANIGSDGTAFFVGLMDELRISKTARWTSSFSVPLTAYSSTSASAYLYIGSTRPISGVKFYIKTANASAATVAAYYWSGSAFAPVTSLIDGTAIVAGKTLSGTGVISFTSTVGLCKVKAITENVAYYYQFVFTGIDAATEISQVSLVAPVQNLVDIWDGFPRQIYSFLIQRSSYADYTLQVYKLDFSVTDPYTFVSASIGTTEYYYAGFNERLLGFKVYFGGTNVNTSPGVVYVDYWDGKQWVSEGALDDGTSVSGITFNRSGVVTWNPPSEKLEYVTSVGNSSQWYYYRIHFSVSLSNDVYIDNLIGIPAQVSLHPYRFPVLWQNRLWLFNDQSKDKNVGIGSSYGTVCVFNGTDSPRLTFGGTQEVMCAAPLFTRYGGNIYENLVVCKRNQTYLVDGTSPATYIVYKIASTVGCIAPQTMKICDTGYEVAPGLTKHVVVWLSASGVVMFDANSVINISADIDDRFDEASDNYINTAISEQFTSFYDAKNCEYHIQIATGTSTTLNEEWVYDLVHRKWYQVYRGIKYLTCGFEVEDDIGNKYVYGGTDDGFLERLEYGNTFDGVSITYKFRLPDGLLDRSLMYVKEVRRVKITGKCNSVAANVTIRHYADGSTTASAPAMATFSQNVSGKRIYQIGRSVIFKAVFHSFEFEVTTNDSASGFNPLYVSGFYRVIREDLEQ